MNSRPFPTLQTNRLVLREIQESDAESIYQEYWRQGYVTEAFQVILQFGFQEMKLMRIQALIEPPNTASQKLAEKNGFVREGLLRKYEYSRGEFVDLYMYSLLREEFRTSLLRPGISNSMA